MRLNNDQAVSFMLTHEEWTGSIVQLVWYSPEVTTRRARRLIGGDELMLLLEGNRVKCQTRKDLEVIRSIAAPFNLRLAIRKERRTDDAPEQGPLRPRRGSSGEQPLKEVRRHRCG